MTYLAADFTRDVTNAARIAIGPGRQTISQIQTILSANATALGSATQKHDWTIQLPVDHPNKEAFQDYFSRDLDLAINKGFGGNLTGAQMQTALTAVSSAIPEPPQNTVAPVVSGSTVHGNALTTTNGTWVGAATITYAYQWFSASNPVGTNANTYTTVVGDTGNTVRCRVTATNAYGSTISVSNAVGPIT